MFLRVADLKTSESFATNRIIMMGTLPSSPLLPLAVSTHLVAVVWPWFLCTVASAVLDSAPGSMGLTVQEGGQVNNQGEK